MNLLNRLQFILTITLIMLLGIESSKIIKLQKEVEGKNRQIENLVSINRVQEDWLRSCGFYGGEE